MISTRVNGQNTTIELCARGTASYARCVQLAKAVYSQSYGATINPTPQLFLACIDSVCGEVTACAGITSAYRNELFSERYLDCSLDQALQGVFGYPVERNKVVEITSLATKTPRMGAELVTFLPLILWFLGNRAVLCTIIEKLQLLFVRHRLPFSVLAHADRTRVPEQEGVDWGSYYDAKPRTCLVRLDQIGHLFQSHCGRYDLQPTMQASRALRAASLRFEGTSLP